MSMNVWIGWLVSYLQRILQLPFRRRAIIRDMVLMLAEGRLYMRFGNIRLSHLPNPTHVH